MTAATNASSAQNASHLTVGADGFELPLDVVTEATAIVATRGAGKSSASTVIVEEAFAAGVQTVVFDRTGVYWGLRSTASGEEGGLPVYVLGGPHGDVPLEPTAGRMIADLVVDTGHSFVLDLSDFSKANAIKFAADFLERLYDRKARARTTTLLVLDEAHFYAPQTPRGGFKGDAARLMGAMEDVVGLGRSRGLGVVLTTQRTQALNKAVLDLIETLLVMRMLSSRARNAVKEWIQEKHEDDEHGVLASLSSLPTGTAWVWSPLRGILEKVAVRRIRTFDSYRTPKPGEAAVEPAARQELDLTALGEQIAATVEKAKADDPKALRARIRELERELTQRPAGTEDQSSELEWAKDRIGELTERVEVAARRAQVAESALDGLVGEGGRLRTVLLPGLDGLARLADEFRAELDGYANFTQDDGAARSAPSDEKGVHSIAAPARPRAQAPADRGTGRTAMDGGRGRSPGGESAPSSARAATGNGSGSELQEARRLAPLAPVDVTPARQKVLDALAWFAVLGIREPRREALAPLAGSKATSGGFKNNLGALRSAGLIDYPTSGCVALTADGTGAARFPERPGTSEELQAAVLGTLTPARQAILRVLIDAYPMYVDRERLAAAVGVPPTSGGFKNNLGAMRTQGVIDYPAQGRVVAADLLFLDGDR